MSANKVTVIPATAKRFAVIKSDEKLKDRVESIKPGSLADSTAFPGGLRLKIAASDHLSEAGRTHVKQGLLQLDELVK